MVLVTGAAGKTGRAVIQAMAERGLQVRALVRRRSQVEVVIDLGARDVHVGDMQDPDVLSQAAQGAKAIYHICPNMSPDEIALGVIAIGAAKSAGLSQFLYHSVLHPQIEAMPHHWNKMRVEELLFTSGLDFTILQPAAYMQNILGGWNNIVQEGVYRAPYPAHTRIALVDLHDVAEVAAEAAMGDGHNGATYELVGQDDLTQEQVTDVLSHQLGRPVRVEHIPIQEWRQEAGPAGLGSYQLDSMSRMFRYYEQYGFVGNAAVLACLLSRPPTTFDDFVARHISARRS